MLRSRSLAVPLVLMIFAASACAGPTVAPNAGPALQALTARPMRARPVDNTSILQQDKVQVSIASTVDTTNGDMGPSAIAIVPGKKTLQKGNLVVCNFENSAGYPGEGTTLEVVNPTTDGVRQFAESSAIEGCDAVALNTANDVYAGGLTSGELAVFLPTGKPNTKLKYGSNSPVGAPLSDSNAPPAKNFDPEYMYVGATTSGGIASIAGGEYGDNVATQVAEGFAVSQGSGPALGPSGLQFYKDSSNSLYDLLYIVDGVTNTIVAFTNPTELIAQDEIVVEPGGETFSCEYPNVTCGVLIYADSTSYSPLDAPVASALLPNGNLIVANTQGTPNTLVEVNTITGQILDTRVVNPSDSTPGIYGLVASGTKDSNTVIYFTDMNTNYVYELEK